MASSPLPDDHEDKWVYRKHTRAKHEVLHYYLKVWTSIVSNPRYTIRVFDCFAGRGDYVDSEGAPPILLDNITSEATYPGSPVLTIDAVSEHADKFKSAECFFIEPNHRNREILQDTLALTSFPDNVHPRVRNNQFPDNILDIIQETGENGGFAFFFIDPYNIKDLDYDTITTIARTDRFDCLITVMTGQIIRWQDSESHQEGFKQFYGIPDWRERLEKYVPEELTTREAEFYCKRLEENGPEYTLAYMTTDGDSRQLKYHLTFTTNSDRGIEAMKESMMRCGGDYTLAYAPARTELQHGQQTFNSGTYLTDEERVKAWLLSRFAGEEITFDEVVRRSLTEQVYEEALRQDYRRYLKELHTAGEIEIPERDSPDGPLPERYEIRFPTEFGND